MPLVLIVDDDARIRALMARLLETSGYSAVEAAHGKEARGLMRRRRPCVILLDLQMPIMDGWEFRRQQLADPELADVPVICLNGFSHSSALLPTNGGEAV